MHRASGNGLRSSRGMCSCLLRRYCLRSCDLLLFNRHEEYLTELLLQNLFVVAHVWSQCTVLTLF